MELNILPPAVVGSYPQPEWLIVAPDCGMKYLPRDSAYQKLKAPP